MTRLFITASGTDIGKTFVTAGLAKHCHDTRLSARVVKPVVSGYRQEAFAQSDTAMLLEAMDQPGDAAHIDLCSPWRFAAPLSPDMAAFREGKTIDFNAVVAWCQKALSGPEEVALVEGVGGVMVPIDDTHTVRDWIEQLQIPSVLVVGSYLGTISHTLTALAALGKLPVRAVVVNESESSPVPLEETAAAIGRFTSAKVTTLRRNVGSEDFAALFNLLTM